MPRIALPIIDNPTGCINTGPNGEAIYCPQLATAYFGQRWYCRVFRMDDMLRDEDGVQSGPGKLQRWAECKAAQIPE